MSIQSHHKEPRVAIISSLRGGLGHYNAHLAKPLGKLCYLKFVTYPQLDLTGTPVNQITDSLIKRYIKWPRFDIREEDPLTIVQISEYLRSKNVNLINIHVATTVKRKIYYFTTFINYIKQMNHMKFVFTLHDVFPFDEDKRLAKLLQGFYSLADYFTVGNSYERDKLVKHFGIDRSNIQIVRHGIYDLFDNNLHDKRTARSFLDIPKDKKVILFFGFMRPYKGFEYLVRAVKKLTKKNKDIIVYVASGTSYASREYVESLYKLISKLELRDQFILNFKYLDTFEIEAVFKASDIVALPYIHASQSGVMMMAFGFKRPVVLSDVFYDKKWISKKAGLVFQSKDVDDFARKLNILLSDSSLAKKYGDYGYKYSKRELNWSKIAHEYYETYKHLLQ